MASSVRAARSGLHKRPTTQPRVTRRRVFIPAAKLITSSDIPAFIPRKDLMEQLWRWAEIEVVANGTSNFGIACDMEPFNREDCPWGFKVHMKQDGKTVTSLKMGFDEEEAIKHAFVGRKENGMPQPEGDITKVVGAHFEMWKVDEEPVTPEIREAIRGICVALSAAMTRYYSFGSVFAEDI